MQSFEVGPSGAGLVGFYVLCCRRADPCEEDQGEYAARRAEDLFSTRSEVRIQIQGVACPARINSTLREKFWQSARPGDTTTQALSAGRCPSRAPMRTRRPCEQYCRREQTASRTDEGFTGIMMCYRGGTVA
jgi:hypothetical protein